jgi:predicted deacetylase
VSAPPTEPAQGAAGAHGACGLVLPGGKPALCVAIHDVAPATWRDCLRLLQAVREVADIPLTWLVVPHWHGGQAGSGAFEATLDSLLADGHELALHGYTHLDSAARAGNWHSRFLRGVVTEGEGEFAALDAHEARRRIDLGLAWFERRGWPLHGFVAPAWLLGDGAWEALRAYSFLYTTTWTRFHCLAPFARPEPPGLCAPPWAQPGAVLSPALVYAARNRAGRIVSPCAVSTLAWLLRAAPLLRLALHPRDAWHPVLLRHAQALIEQALQSRQALTKGDFARQWTNATSTAPNTHPAASEGVPARHGRADTHSGAGRRAR